MIRKKLFLDFDGVIANTIEGITSLYNEDFAAYPDYQYVPWWRVETWCFKECNCATPDYIDHYFNQQRFFERLNFMPWAKEVISILCKVYNVTIVSHGYSPNLLLKEAWIKARFPDIKFIGVDLYKHSDKSCVDMYGGIFIDDNANNLKTSNAQYKFCFGDLYEWNKDWYGERLYNWTDVYLKLIGGDIKF